MKILMVDDDEALLSFFARQLERRGFETHQSVNGDEALHVWQELGPWEFVLTAYRFMPGTIIKDGVQLLTAIHGISPFQRMAIMTATPTEARGRCSASHSGLSKCCGSCGCPCCPSN